MKTRDNDYMYGLYLDSFIRAVKEFADDPDNKDSTIHIERAILYGVKAINVKPKDDYLIREHIENEFSFINAITKLMGTLTPGEFMQVFPIEKEYKGHKWGMKDYFYTRDYIKTLDPDKPIGPDDEILEFLWEYHNWEISLFVVASMECISNWNRLNGEPTFMDEFAEEMGLKTYTMHTDNQGNSFMLDGETGKTMKVSKPRPKHLKVVK